MDKTMSLSMEFKELTKRDAERCLAMELEKLKRTGNLPQLQAQMIDKEFSGFQKLFTNFLAAESVSAIEWERIEKLPHDAVSYLPFEPSMLCRGKSSEDPGAKSLTNPDKFSKNENKN